MPDKTLKQIDVLRHELKALRYILDNFHAGKLPSAALPPREDFLSGQAREIYETILRAPSRDAADARLAEALRDPSDGAPELRGVEVVGGLHDRELTGERDLATVRAPADLADVDVASFLRLSGDHYYTYPALVHERAEALRAGRLRIEAA